MDAQEAPRGWRALPAVETRRGSWMQPCDRPQEEVRWRPAAEGLPPAARMIRTPDALDAPYAKKDPTSWVGYTVHWTERCEPEPPHLITPVETTAGPVADAAVTNAIPAQLQAKQLLPHLHIVATGYLDAERLVTSPRDDGVDWLGPTRPDDTGPARAGQGFAASQGVRDWPQRQARCPMGQASSRWTPAPDGQNHEVITITFAPRDGQACASRLDGPRAQRRTITVRPAEHPVS